MAISVRITCNSSQRAQKDFERLPISFFEMLKKLKRLFHRRSRRREEHEALKKEAVSGQSSSTKGAQDTHYAREGRKIAERNPVSGLNNTRHQPSETADTNDRPDFHEWDFTREAEAHNEHPAIRPLSLDLEPRSPVQHLKPHDAPRRDSGSSNYSHGSVAASPQPAHPPEDTAAPASSQQGIGRATEHEANMSLEDSSAAPEMYEGTEVDVDYTLDSRTPVTHEHIKPHVHTIYEPRRTRSIHFEEHRYMIQPVIVPASQYEEERPVLGEKRESALGTGSLLRKKQSNY